MSEPTMEPTGELQFDVAEANGPAAPVAATCVGCRRPIVGTYYAVGNKLVCPSCRGQLDAPPPGAAVGRVLKATVSGTGAGLVGAAIWFAIRRAAHLQIGLVAVLVGFLVGKAVRNGSANRGGAGYQVLAVVITYCCITANYMPDVYEAFVAARDRPVATDHRSGSPQQLARTDGLPWTKMAELCLKLPFLSATENPIGLLIIGFALWEAWKFNARRRLPITGPYQVATRPPPGGLATGVAR